MAKPYDAALNSVLDAHAADWAAFLAARAGVPPGPATPLDTDLFATLQADRLFRVDGPEPAVLHLELESGDRRGIPDELLAYNVAARARHKLPVHSVLVLLRPKATARDLTGRHVVRRAGGRPYRTFHYPVGFADQLAAIADAGRLERVADRLLTAATWADLLAD